MNLSHTNNLFQSLIDSMDKPVIVYDNRLNSIYANRLYVKNFIRMPENPFTNLSAAGAENVIEHYKTLKNGDSDDKRVFYKNMTCISNKTCRVKSELRVLQDKNSVFLMETILEKADVSFIDDPGLTESFNAESISFLLGEIGNSISRDGSIQGLSSCASQADEVSDSAGQPFFEMVKEDGDALLNIYHFFRPSLNSILGITDLLERRISSDSVTDDYLCRIRSSVRKLIDFLNTAHLYIQIRTGHHALKKERLDLRACFTELLESEEGESGSTQLNFQSTVPPFISTDRNLFCDFLHKIYLLLRKDDHLMRLSVTFSEEISELKIRFFRALCDDCSFDNLQEKPEFLLLTLFSSLLGIVIEPSTQGEQAVIQLSLKV